MRTLWPIGSVSDETLLFLSSQTFASSASEGVLLGAAERAKTFETNPPHLRYMRGLIGVLQRVTISLLSRVRLFFTPPPRRPGLLLVLIHPSAWKAHCELRPYGVLGSWH